MGFQKKDIVSVFIKKKNSLVIKESVIFTDESIYFFGIVANFLVQKDIDLSSWLIVYKPSGRAFLNFFNQKKDAENFLYSIAERKNINSIEFIDFNFERLSKKIFTPQHS